MIFTNDGLKVHYETSLDGSGSWFARSYVDWIRKSDRPHYKRCFEWCAGPAFIGFSLLHGGVVDELVLADINPEVRPWIEKTRESNNLEFTYYESDNFKQVPEHEKFDLVVGNSPSYVGINPENPQYEKMKNDIRANDQGWRIHEEFYLNVRKHLNPGADLLISEVEPLKTEVYLRSTGTETPYDVRPTEALSEWKKMIEKGGLEYVGMDKYMDFDGAGMYLVRSKNPD